MIDLDDAFELGRFVVKPPPPPPSGEEILANLTDAMRKLTTCVVVHPADADTVRAAAAQIPPPSIVEVTESVAVDRGTAIVFPKDGGPMRDVKLPPPAGSGER